MSMLLNEEQTLLKQSARELFTKQAPLKALRHLRDRRDTRGFDHALWRSMIELGWAGIIVPETYGGVDFGYKGLGQLLEEGGRTLAASPLFSSVLVGTTCLLRGGSESQHKTWLPRLAAGDCLLSLALDESPRHAPTSIATTATSSSDGFVLNGEKAFVLDGHIADCFIVIARTGGESGDTDGLSGFLIPRDAQGLHCERLSVVDSRNAARLRLTNVWVPRDALLGAEHAAWTWLAPTLDAARIGLAAEMLGSGAEAFERTVNYLKLREQFGVKIGSFQALKHRAALMFCELELTTSAVLEALTALDEQRTDVPALASLAKAKACDMLELVTNEAVQMHGGIGMTDAEEIGFFLKRARVAQQLFGDAVFQRDRYATLMGY